MDHSGLGYISYRISVPDEFQDVFSHFYFAGNHSDQLITKTLLPSYQTIMVFSFAGHALIHTHLNEKIEVEKCIVLGPIKKAFDYSLRPNNRILVANFIDDAFYRFFGTAALVGNLPIDADSLLEENCFAVLWDRLSGLTDTTSQVSHILEFCRPYLRDQNTITGQLLNLRESAYNPIKRVADHENLSERSIQLNHKKHFGYSAKEITRYQRFLKAIEMIQNVATKATKDDWFNVIEECGYYDQSQMINDFKYYLGLTPTQYIKLQRDICNPIS